MTVKNEDNTFGWRVAAWADAVGISRASTHELLAAKTIESVRFRSVRIITTHPRDFLAGLR